MLVDTKHFLTFSDISLRESFPIVELFLILLILHGPKAVSLRAF